MADVDERVSRLLDQLEMPGISEKEIDRINQKIEILQGQRS